MEQQPLEQVEALALKKLALWNRNTYHFLLRSILASAFIGFGVLVAFATGNPFYAVNSPAAAPLAAIAFGAAIILIGYAGGDLFTGNTFYFTFTTLRGKITWGDTLKVWVTSYLGNLIGAILFAALLWASGLFKEPYTNPMLIHLVEKKMHVSTFQLFFRAIMCNWLVCMAFFIPMALKGDMAKMFAMILFVYCFFIAGLEHCIANLSSFSIVLMMDHPDTITIGGAIHNIIPVTIGNMIGGGIFMGVIYYLLNPRIDS